MRAGPEAVGVRSQVQTMSSPQLPVSLTDSVGRIWARISANSADIGDMFERIAQSFYSKIVRPGDTVIDGGAHAGRHTIPLARLVGPHGTVMAFEPLPSAAALLRRLLTASRLDGNVELRPQALAREQGRRDFFIVRNMPEFSGLKSRKYSDGFVPDESRIEVDVTTLDAAVDVSRLRGSLPFIKLDLEGGELRALQGGERTLRTLRPACVFENGLGSSADGYDADEFFRFFRDLDYALHDILGCPVNEARWEQSGPWYFVGVPMAQASGLLPLLWTSALEELLTSAWLPVLPADAPGVRLVSSGTARPPVTGHVDRIESCIRVSGWAGDPATGRPAASVVISIDGAPVAAARPGKTRHDVVAATGQVGLAEAGFDFVVRVPPPRCVEVHAEADDGTVVRLGGSES